MFIQCISAHSLIMNGCIFFELTNSYDLVYKWFDILKIKGIEIIGYCAKSCLWNYKQVGVHKWCPNFKNFTRGTYWKRKEEKQLHKVFKDSFDAKAIFSEKFLIQKLNYIHYNPITGKWKLAKDFVSYEHSSALFYE